MSAESRGALRPESLIAVVATGPNGLIGAKGRLPWRCPEDMRHFRALTMGHPVIMGRTTHESIGKALPGRTHIVLSRNPPCEEPDPAIHWVSSPEKALALAAASKGGERAFVIGGKQIYLLFWPLLDEVFHSRIDAPEAQGDLHLEIERLLAPPLWRQVAAERRRGFELEHWVREPRSP